MIGKLLISALLLAFVNMASMQVLSGLDCGDGYGCVRSPAGCTSNCAYLMLYKSNATDVNIKVSVRGNQWIGVGFNRILDLPMIGTRGVICKEQMAGPVETMAFNNTAKQRPPTTPTDQAGGTVNSARTTDGSSICDFTIPLGGNSYFYALNVSGDRLVVMAWGNLSPGTNLINYHGAGNTLSHPITITSSAVFEAAATSVDLSASECGTTYACTKGPAGCFSSVSCDYLIMYKRDGLNVNFKMSMRDNEWVGVGFNEEVMNPMIGARGVICKMVSSAARIQVFNATMHGPPMTMSTDAANVTVTSLRLHNGAIICEFSIPFAGNDVFHSLDTAATRLMIGAWGPLAADRVSIFYHGRSNRIANAVNVSERAITEPASNMLTAAGCGIDYSCARIPRDCVTDCEVLILYRRNNAMVEVKMMVRNQQWIGFGFNTAKNTEQMIGAQGFICKNFNSDVSVNVFNALSRQPPATVSAQVGGVTVLNLRTVPNGHVCEFNFPFEGNANLRNLSTGAAPLIVAAHGPLMQGSADIAYHGQGNYIFSTDDLSAIRIIEPPLSAGHQHSPQVFLLFGSIAVLIIQLFVI